MPRLIFSINLLILAVFLVACGPQDPVDSTVIWIDAPLEGAALTDEVHDVAVHATHSGEVGLIGVIFEHPGRSYGVYASPPGEPLDDLYVANFEITGYAYEAVVPFDFDPASNSASFNGEYTLRACLFGPFPQSEVIECTEITVYMPECGPGEVSLGPDCMPAAVDSPTPLEEPEFELIAIPDRNVNCRQGPSGSLFEIDDTLLEGVEYKPLGVGPDGLWMLFLGPVSQNPCWALTQYLDLTCDGQQFDPVGSSCNLTTETYPPLPTATPTPLDITYATPTEPPPQCVDGLDNDGDGLTDYQPAGSPTRGDQQCTGQTDNDEAN